jgi:coproporphyrinogen III oxidase-like Fe-S oxidoreductase
LHIPFCVVLCPFCSFHRVQFHEDKATRYFSVLRREIQLVHDLGYQFDELYIGGGTPTVLPEQLVNTIEFVSSLHPLAAVSVESNPSDLNVENLANLKGAGVNRLSIGVQSFDNDLLREMGRIEKYGSGEQICTELAAIAGVFDTTNVDMIFNFPHQSEAQLMRDLELLTSQLAIDQVSWYPLMTTATTARPMRRAIGSVDHEREKAYYEIIVSHMLAAGYERSSAWCFSRQPGLCDEYIIDHEEYVGLGSGAFSYLGGALYANTFSINHYAQLLAAAKTSAVRKRDLSKREQMRYFLLMQLFSGHLDLANAEQRFDGQFERMIWRDIRSLQLIGAVDTDGSDLRLTESGYYLWVVLMREFFSGINSFRDDMRHDISREMSRLSSNFG